MRRKSNQVWNPSSGRVERVPERSFGPVHRLPPSERYPERFGVTSNDLDREYVVARRDGVWSCSCPHWTRRREECKHITRVINWLAENKPTHYWRVRKQLPERFKAPCRVYARSSGPGPRNVGVEFEDGTRVVTTMWNIRRLPDDRTMPKVPRSDRDGEPAPRVPPACARPCAECPFRVKALRGWIGGHKHPQEIADIAEHRGFPCHTAVNAAVERGTDFDAAVSAAPLCRGSLIVLNNSCTLSRNRAVAEAQKQVGRDHKAFFRTMREFVAYHERQ